MSALSQLRDFSPDVFAAKYGQPSESLLEAICELADNVDALRERLQIIDDSLTMHAEIGGHGI